MVVSTPVPASSRTMTYSHRLARSERGDVRVGNSSTTHAAGCCFKMAAVSISSNELSRYSIRFRAISSRARFSENNQDALSKEEETRRDAVRRGSGRVDYGVVNQGFPLSTCS